MELNPASARRVSWIGLAAPHPRKKTVSLLIPRTTKPHTRKKITMRRIRTSKSLGRPRLIYALVVCTLIAAVGARSGMAADKGPKVTLVYDHALPNVPGKSMKGVLVEYGPGGTSSAHTHPKSAFIYATVLEGAIRSSVNNGPIVTYRTGESFSEMPDDRHSVSANRSEEHTSELQSHSDLVCRL